MTKAADLVQSALADTDIHCHISTLTGATPTQYIELEANGEKDFVRYDEGVLKDFVSAGSSGKLSPRAPSWWRLCTYKSLIYMMNYCL